MRKAGIIASFILMVCAAGCGTKLDITKSFEVPAGGDHILTVEKIKQEQTIKITGTATGAPVDVFVYLDSNKEKARKEILNRKSEQFILKKQEKAEAIDLAVLIPANEEAVVFVESTGKKANVQLTITNR